MINKKIVENIFTELKEGLARPQNLKSHDLGITKVLRAIKECSRAADLQSVTMALRWVADWWGSEAMVLSKGDMSKALSKLGAFAESWWLYYHVGGSLNGYPYLQNHALLFLGLNQAERVEWMFPRLEPSHPSKRFQYPAEDWILQYPLEFYCRCLWACYNHNNPDEADIAQCGVYSAIFQHWETPDELAGAIYSACDYHLAHAGEPKGYDIYEFDLSQWQLLPIEILALRTVREKLGLAMPEVDHPLLNTPLVKDLPRALPEVHEELLDKVKALVGKFHQESTAVTPAPTPTTDPAPSFSTEEKIEKTGFLRRTYHLNATMRFVSGETLNAHWPRLLEALAAWLKKRGKNASILTITFKSDPALHLSLYQEFTSKTQVDAKMEAWIESLQDYSLSFQDLDGTDCRDLIWEKQPDGSNLFTEMKFTPME